MQSQPMLRALSNVPSFAWTPHRDLAVLAKTASPVAPSASPPFAMAGVPDSISAIALRALRVSERRYRRLFETARDGVLLLNADTAQIEDVNPYLIEMLGYSHAEFLGKKLWEVGTFSDIVESKEMFQELQTTGYIRYDDLPLRTKTGAQIAVEFVSNTYECEGIKVIQCNIRNITERKQTEEALRIAAVAFESQQGMTVCDAQQVILRVNRAFTEITGYTAEEVVGHTSRMLSSGRHDASFFAAMWRDIGQTGSWQGEIWNRRKCGEVFPGWLNISAVKDDVGRVTHYVAIFTDITSSKTAEDQIKNLAFYDPLTGLPNRRLLMDRLGQALAASERHKRRGALLFVDLDNFKTINDTLGHHQGDLLLEQVAKRLATCIREGDTVARLGGDEFVVILENLSEIDHEAATQAETVGEKILFTLNQIYQLGSYAHHSTPSIGVTLFGGVQHESIDEPLKRADLAMYQAKAAGRNTLRFFDPQMQADAAADVALEADLREAVLQGQLLLYYQAQVVGEGRLTGAEALVRWQHPLRGLVSPAEFIPLAEDTGLILAVGQWVLETACAQLALWAIRPEMAHLMVAVNVSARQFHSEDFVDQVLATLDRTGANPKRLKLELTESLLVDDVEGTIAKMITLKARGVCFSLDDFGTGFSSLSYLKRLPLDQLKIDQGFIRNVLTDPNDAAIAKMVIALAESLGLAVIAEGVEIEAQSHFLARQGCHAYQGYLFSRPLPIEAFEAFAGRA